MRRDDKRRATLFAELDTQEVGEVASRLSQGVYGEHNDSLVREWLGSRGSEPGTPPVVAGGFLARLYSQPVGIIRRKPGRVVRWIVIIIVLLELLGLVASALFSSPAR